MVHVLTRARYQLESVRRIHVGMFNSFGSGIEPVSALAQRKSGWDGLWALERFRQSLCSFEKFGDPRSGFLDVFCVLISGLE